MTIRYIAQYGVKLKYLNTETKIVFGMKFGDSENNLYSKITLVKSYF